MKKAFFPIFLLATIFFLGCTKPSTLTIYMVGDSTMADYPDTLTTPIRGWGQVLPTFLSETTKVRNHAKDGRSTKSFLAEGRWDKVMKKIGKGDVVVIQFGHNDALEGLPALFSTPQEYGENLGAMIRQAKMAGAFPIVCTPIASRLFINDSLQYIHGDYPAEAKKTAERENVPLVDLTTITMEWLNDLGDEESKPYFVYRIEPGEYKWYPKGKYDNNHLRLKGAVAVAKLFSEAILKQDIKPLSEHIDLEDNSIKYTKLCKID